MPKSNSTLPVFSVFSKDPDASYDVNDGDPDPQPRYTQLNDNRLTSTQINLISTLLVSWPALEPPTCVFLNARCVRDMSG